MATPATDNPAVPPIPYVVASWLGFPLEHIVAGLRRGSIAPPAGAPPGWLPPGADGVVDESLPPDASSEAPEASADAAHDDPPEDVPDGDSLPAIDLRAAYADLVREIDAGVDDGAFDALWTSAGADDAASAAALDALLWRAVGATRPEGLAMGAEGVDALAAAIAQEGTRGTLVDLGDEGSAAVAARARADPSVLAAVAALDRFAFAQRGDDAAGAARFDAMTGERLLSDAWIDDRAKYVAWRAALAEDPDAASDVTAAWRFVDRTAGDAATLVVGEAADVVNQVIYARDGGDRVEGGGAIDRLHGGSGDDELAGGGGDDLVEGGRGDDALDGGTGDDLLDGGTGNDRYAFAHGDGVDTIDDADGAGEILLDDARLDGDDDGIDYALHDDGAGGTTLVIRDIDGGGEIRVRDWHDGALGIRVADGGSEPVDRAPSAPSSGTPRVTKPRYDDITDDATDDATEASNDAPATSAPADDARFPGREAGNESGSGGAYPPAFSPLDRRESIAEPSSVDFDAWTRALRGGPSARCGGPIAPPGVDAGAVTAADLATALAGSAGDDDGDGYVPARFGPWPAVDDLPPGMVPPDVALRPSR